MSAPVLHHALRRRLPLALGLDHLPRGWPAHLADYDVEIGPEGILVRLATQRRWFVLGWDAALLHARPEDGSREVTAGA